MVVEQEFEWCLFFTASSFQELDHIILENKLAYIFIYLQSNWGN